MELSDGSLVLISSDKQEWRLSRDGRRFILEYNTDVEEVGAYLSAEIINFPLATYALAYRKRGCEPRSSIASLLRQIRRTQVSEEDISGVMRWVAQLGYELGLNKQATIFRDIYELSEELDALLELTIAEYSAPTSRR